MKDLGKGIAIGLTALSIALAAYGTNDPVVCCAYVIVFLMAFMWN
jgi:hypothetical protein